MTRSRKELIEARWVVAVVAKLMATTDGVALTVAKVAYGEAAL